MTYYFLRFMYILILPVIIGSIIWFIVSRRRKNREAMGATSSSHHYLALSREDGVSQWFFLLSFFFFFLTLLALNRDFHLNISWEVMILVVSLIGAALAYWRNAIYVLTFSIIGLVMWWVAQGFKWLESLSRAAYSSAPVTDCLGLDCLEYMPSASVSPNSIAILVGVGLLTIWLFSFGYAHRLWAKFKRFSFVYIILGLLPFTALLFFFSNRFSIDAIAELSDGGSAFASWPVSVSLLIFLALLVGTLAYNFSKKIISGLEFSALVIIALVFVGLLFVSGDSLVIPGRRYFGYFSGGGTLTGLGVFFLAFFNIIVFLELLGLILVGYNRHEVWMINLGAALLCVLIFIKYYDWFFSFLDKSIFFIGAGILLLVVGWFMEKSRRRMVANVRQQGTPVIQPTNI